MEAASEPAEMTYPAVFAGSTMLLGQDEVEAKLLSAIRRKEPGRKSWDICWGSIRKHIWGAVKFPVSYFYHGGVP